MQNKIQFFKNSFQKNKDNILILNEKDEYVENFAKQWRDYRDVQIDSVNKFSISKNFLYEMFFGNLNILKNKSVLEIGCGAGRFTEYLVNFAEKCVSIDLSSSIFYNVVKKKNNLILIKADFNKLIPDKKFDIVFCRGVLQHTPDPLKSIQTIHSFAKNGGHVFFDIYKMPKLGYAHPKYLIWRPLIKKLFKYENFESFLLNNIELLLKIKRLIKIIFLNSNFVADSVVPVWDYYNNLPLNKNQLIQWSIMDTLDGIYAKYDYPQKTNKIIKFLIENNYNIKNINYKKNIFNTTIF